MENLTTEVFLYVFVFAAGLLLGGFLVSRPWNNLFRMQHSLGVVGQIDIARKLRSGRTEELLEQLESSFSQHAIFLSEEFDITKETPFEALWVLRDYYDNFGNGIPTEIQPLLNNLGPNPFVSKKCYRVTTSCSADPKCLKNPTSLQPLSNTVDPQGFKGTGNCGSKKRWWWRVPCGKPVTAVVCF